METGKGVVEKNGTKDVVLQISGTEETINGSKESSSGSTSYPVSQNYRSGLSPKESKSSNLELTELQSTTTTIKPPRAPIARSPFSKPKSRLVEPPPPYRTEEKVPSKSNTSSPLRNSPNLTSPNRKSTATTPRESQRSAPITPRTPLIGAPDSEEDEDDEVYQTANLKVRQVYSSKKPKVRVMRLIEWVLFICIVGFLVASLTIHRLQKKFIWGLELWKWCVLVLVVICGRLVTEWFINFLVFLIEMNYLLQKKVLYFVYGLKKSVQVFIWLSLILLTWGLLFNRGVKRSRKTNKILNHVTRALASFLIGAAIWLVKNLLVKLLSSSFQCTRFFDRIQESIFHQYVLRTLSGPPLMEMAEKVGRTPSTGQLSFRNLKKEKGEEKQMGKEEVIDVEKLKKMKSEKVSAWTMKGLINVIRVTGLSTISNTLEDHEDEDEKLDKEIDSEWEAKAAAYRIFENVAKSGNKHIDEEDLSRFLKKEEVDLIFPMFEGTGEPKQIRRKSLKNWLVNVYLERKSLAHSLNDTKTAIEELNRLTSAIVVIVIIIVWFILMGYLTTQILVLISSQLLLIVFMFGNTAKTVFEAIIFVFVMHPFDVGDRCVVDGVQMVVEEMNILSTVFLRYDNEKIFYPNSVLATKPISNFYRSPEMGDAVEFAVDFSTSIETIGALKERLKTYLERKPQHWRPSHSVVVKDIQDVNKMTIALYVTHTINFQNYGDKSSRRSDLVLELKRIFEELGIKYRLLPQEIQANFVGNATAAALHSTWR
ncbi:mechanosensitive ion channel protein 10-like [Humulus lupulus]|uniref:mechanosensitive ion channel protein 10-like n=1 Tax=Humulus lupulus TaxID=3486 RepID=UPI002B406F88|nr:mechanosensitive ion channel protein 10-like [Humulus lupulus]XP_062091118.1 mechanosensitive ion channel protein 10-like [Humulus lupulus]